MRIFIDVGAHYGETLHVALDPKWGFDRIYSLEPASACQSALRAFRDRRVIVGQVALSNRDGTATLHGAGLLGGSLYSDKKQIATAVERVETETVPLVRATDWFRKLPDAEIFLKFNCEGGEADIIEDLLDSGEIKRVTSIYVDFDIRKVASQAHRQAEIERRLHDAGIRYVTTDEIGGTNAGVTTWLTRDCPTVPTAAGTRLYHQLKLYAPLYDQLVAMVGLILPRRLYWWIGRRFGRLARRHS